MKEFISLQMETIIIISDDVENIKLSIESLCRSYNLKESGKNVIKFSFREMLLECY